jgi:hypothetical protein
MMSTANLVITVGLACDEAPGRRVREHQERHALVCPSALDLSARHLRFLTDQLTAHRTAHGTRRRRLSARSQALQVLAHLRLGHTYAQLEVGVSTVYRYICARHQGRPNPRHHRRTEAGLACWADKGYQGAGGTVRVPFRGRWGRLSTGQRAVNAAHARIRALSEQAMATLKTWRLLRKLRRSTARVTSHVLAVLTLHLTCSN